MKKNSLNSICLVLFAIFCLLSINTASAKTKEMVNISYCDNPVFYNVDDSKNLKGGYAYELTASINRYLNWDINYVYSNCNECLKDLKKGKTDLVFGVRRTPKREKKHAFNKEPIAVVTDYICGRVDEKMSNDNYEKFNGKRFGFIKCATNYKKMGNYLEKIGAKVTYIEGKNTKELRSMLINNKIDYFIVNQYNITKDEKIIQKINEHALYIMASKDKKNLLEKFDRAIQRLRLENPGLVKKLLKKVYEDPDIRISSLIDSDERIFISKSKEIRCGVIKNNAPYFYKDDYGNVDGTVRVVIDKIEKDSGLKFVLIPFANVNDELRALKEKKIDAIGMVSDSLYNVRKYNLNLSQPYIASEAVILKTKNIIKDDELKNTYAIERSQFGHEDELKIEIPNAQFKNYESFQECIYALKNGEVGAAIIADFNEKINTKKLKNIDNLVAYFDTGVSFKHCIGFSNEIDVRYLEITDKIVKNFDSRAIKMDVINASNSFYAKKSLQSFLDEYKIQIIILFVFIMLILFIAYLQSLITEKAKLKIGDERFKIASKQSQVAYWEYTYENKKMTFFDDTWVKRHGFKTNVIEGYDVEKRKEYFDEENRKKILEVANSIQDSNEREIQINAKGIDGKMYCYLIKISAMRDKSNKVVKVLGSILDVTDTKNILNRYEQEVKRNEVMGSMLLASFMINLSADKIIANSEYLFAKKDELIGVSYSELFKKYFDIIKVEKQRELFKNVYTRDSLLESFNKGHRDFSVSVRMNYGGKLNWVEVAIHATKDPFTNDIIGIIYVRDAKERETLQSALDLAEAASNAKSNFLSSVSHEIRTPMNAIMGLTDMALEELEKTKKKDSKIYDGLSNIKLSSEYLLDIINDILEMSRIESGKNQLNKKVYDSHAFIKTIITIISMQAHEKNIDFTYITDPNLKRYYIGDEVKLKKIFINILGNAIKFTPNNGKVSYTSKVVFCNDKRSIIKIVITDNGIGINEKFLKHIFEPFSRERGNETQYQGTGLGMAISKNFIKMMDGDIKIESELGKGTTVTMTFAIENYNEGNTAVPKEAKKELSEIKKAELNKVFEGLKILLVEDNKLNIIIANHVLKKMGFKTEIAINGQIAIDMFNAKPKDYYFAILMDIRMPIMGGLEATKIIRKLAREDAKTMPIVAMTANAFDIDRRNSLEAGMNEHITKPIDVAKLAEILSKFIKN